MSKSLQIWYMDLDKYYQIQSMTPYILLTVVFSHITDINNNLNKKP